MTKAKKYQSIWEEIILPRIPDQYLNARNSKYYYKIGIWLHNLLKNVKEEELDIYLKWFVECKLARLDGFSAGILCCNNMIENFKKTGGDYLLQNSRKRIKAKKGEFENQRETEKDKFLDSILQKKKVNKRLSSFEKEALKYLKED